MTEFFPTFIALSVNNFRSFVSALQIVVSLGDSCNIAVEIKLNKKVFRLPYGQNWERSKLFKWNLVSQISPIPFSINMFNISD